MTYEERREIDRIAFFWRLAFKNRSDAYPHIADWTPISEGRHIDAEFTIDGQRFAVTWKHDYYGSDRADWDDGWWPDFFAIVPKRRGLVPWRRPTRVEIYWTSGDRTLAGQLAELTS